jgi:hypothetical protein
MEEGEHLLQNVNLKIENIMAEKRHRVVAREKIAKTELKILPPLHQQSNPSILNLEINPDINGGYSLSKYMIHQP